MAVTAACFANQKYEDAAASRCISNLLAAGFRRLEADVFWDASQGNWTLCPVELGSSDQVLTTSTSLLPNATDSASLSLNARQTDQLTSQTPEVSLSSVSVSDASQTLTVSADATTTALDGTGTATAYTDGSAIQTGGYICTTTVNFEFLLSVLAARLTDTATDLNASTVILTLNLHAAALASAPSASAQKPIALPSFENSLSSVISRNLSQRVYTPSNLVEQRGSLNSSQSWFTVNPAEQPASAYFQVDTSGSTSSTPDGWPGEAYVEMSADKRLLIEFGSIDPQMTDYDLSFDASTIFPPEYLTSQASTTYRSNGTLATGCFFDPSDTTITDNNNNSWATSQIGNGITSQGDLLQGLAFARSLTDCGIAPFLNETLAGFTADERYAPYLAFVESTIWSWGPGQPLNSSLSDDVNDYRCAALNATSGRWQAEDCGSSRYGACRLSGEPYGWKITYAPAPYDRIDLACDEGSTFDVPRTSLENAHLLSVWRTFRENEDDDNGPLLSLDFNQLDISACWVIGSNSTCPYQERTNSETRRIVVPVVGAIIVFVLAALTVLIKCAGNRQTAKRRKRRGNDGWDYEGVPS